MSKFMLLGATLAMAFSCCSCVTRTLTIESDPPGARVLMERKDIGTTPVTFDFEYGGVREFLILHEQGGTKYAPVRIHHDSEEFFLDTFPFDIVSRLQPVSINRDFIVQVTLEESILIDIVQDDESNYVTALMNRAEQLRQRAKIQQEQSGPGNQPLLPPLKPGLTVQDEDQIGPNLTPNVSNTKK
ncbi:MAG: hypothetical protein ACI97A_002197 [Planctomycetota bacterium]|jgi:hypothetical protein